MKFGMSSTCIGEVGNNNQLPKPTKRISSSKIWCFTINNYKNKDIVLMSSLYPMDAEYICFQEEKGKEGTPHLQGVIKFNKDVRPLEYKQLKELSSGHWTKCRNFKASIEYCKKSDTRFGEIYEFPKPYNINISLYEWQKEIIKIIKDNIEDDRTIYWYWSKEGCKGKTTFCKYLTINYGAICLHGKGNDIRNGVLDYYNKNNNYPNLCVFPIPRSYNDEYLSYEGLENIKDMYFYSGKYEGGMVCGPCPFLFVFANVPPNLEMCSKDRWVVREII